MYVPQQPYWAKMWLVQREVSSGILGIIQLPQSSLKKDLCRAVLKHQGRSLLPAGQPWKAWTSSVILAVANCCTSRACPQLSMKSFQHSWEADMTCPSEHVLASTHAWQEGPQQEDPGREPQAYSFPNIPLVQGAGLVHRGGSCGLCSFQDQKHAIIMWNTSPWASWFSHLWEGLLALQHLLTTPVGDCQLVGGAGPQKHPAWRAA